VLQVGSVEEKLLAVLGNRAQPLVNTFDSDALFHQPPQPPGMLNTGIDVQHIVYGNTISVGKYFFHHTV